MTPAEYLARRNSYAYPAVRLDGSCAVFRGRDFRSLKALEDYHQTLLRSTGDERAVFGYLSVLYWGHYSGQDKVARSERALGKVRLAKAGSDRKRNGRHERMRGVDDIGITAAAEHLRSAAARVDAGLYGEALKTLCELPGLQFAFGSKVAAFLSPENCGVIDSIIAEKYPQFGFAVNADGYIRKNNPNAGRYTKYCELLAETAASLNAGGDDMKWTDFDKTRHSWRAVDVERAMY